MAMATSDKEATGLVPLACLACLLFLCFALLCCALLCSTVDLISSSGEARRGKGALCCVVDLDLDDLLGFRQPTWTTWLDGCCCSAFVVVPRIIFRIFPSSPVRLSLRFPIFSVFPLPFSRFPVATTASALVCSSAQPPAAHLLTCSLARLLT